MVLHLLFFTIVLAIVNDIIEMIGDWSWQVKEILL